MSHFLFHIFRIYTKVNCLQECYYNVMSNQCKCQFPDKCPPPVNWTDECMATFNNKSFIRTECKKNCPAECRLVSFPIVRTNNKWDTTENNAIRYYKTLIKLKYNITGMTDAQIGSRLSHIYIHYNITITKKLNSIY